MARQRARGALRARPCTLVLAALLTLAGAAEAAREPIEVSTRQISRFSPRPIEGARLSFQGGLVLSGPRRMGALSGLLVEDDRLLAVTDTGDFFEARLVLEAGRLVGIADPVLAPRLDTEGNPITTKREGDAEALARQPGRILVLVEEARRLLAYPADGLTVDVDAKAEALPLSPEERRAGSRGWESLATRPDGSLLAIAEGREGKARETPAFIVGGRRFAIRRRDDFAITGADILPGGDMLLVERRYRGGLDVSMRVRRIGADAVARGGLADGPVLLEADFSAEIDNMEAIAAEVRDGTIVLTLASDDNHSFFQRTLLLRFSVSDPLPRRKPERSAAPL